MWPSIAVAWAAVPLGSITARGVTVTRPFGCISRGPLGGRAGSVTPGDRVARCSISYGIIIGCRRETSGSVCEPVR